MIMTNISVGMGEIKFSNTSGDILIAPGLGSCIGIAMYDPKHKAGGLAHVVLPCKPTDDLHSSLAGKYADTAIPMLLSRMLNSGARKENIIVRIAGGSQMFTIEKGSNILNIGLRNAIAVKAALEHEGLRLKASDTGGNKGRTVRLDVMSGIVYVRILGQQETVL